MRAIKSVPHKLKDDVVFKSDNGTCSFNACRTKFTKQVITEIELYDNDIRVPRLLQSHSHECTECGRAYKTSTDKRKDKESLGY